VKFPGSRAEDWEKKEEGVEGGGRSMDSQSKPPSGIREKEGKSVL